MYIYYVHYCHIMFVHVLWTRVIRGCYAASYNVHWMYISSGESYIFVNNLCYLQKRFLQECTKRNSKCSFNVGRCKVRQHVNATKYMSEWLLALCTFHTSFVCILRIYFVCTFSCTCKANFQRIYEERIKCIYNEPTSTHIGCTYSHITCTFCLGVHFLHD